MDEQQVELTNFQVLTAGLFSGDPIRILISFRIVNNGFFRYAPWRWKIQGTLNGQIASQIGDEIGVHGGRDNLELTFTGKMPSGVELRGDLVFSIIVYAMTPQNTVFATKTLVIPNLDDVPPPAPPNGDPPAVCTEGQTRCDGYNQLVCKNGSWIIKERNSAACGYVLPQICPEGTRRCVGTTLQKCVNNQWTIEKLNATECGYVPPPSPTPPNEEPPVDGSWFERNKTLIIVISVAVLAIAVVMLMSKTTVRSPIESPPKFQRPIIRRGR